MCQMCGGRGDIAIEGEGVFRCPCCQGSGRQ